MERCRICLDGAVESNTKLISPCNCKGSVKYVHRSCLDKWRRMNFDNRNRDQCQVCNSAFKVSQRTNWTIKSLRILIGTLAFIALVPLSYVSLYLSIHSDKCAWSADVFPFLTKTTLDEINKLIYDKRAAVSRNSLFFGMTKLGCYGCFVWIWMNGLASLVPQQPSVVLTTTRILCELFLVPRCLQVPTSKRQVPVFFCASAVGLYFVWSKITDIISKHTHSLGTHVLEPLDD